MAYPRTRIAGFPRLSRHWRCFHPAADKIAPISPGVTCQAGNAARQVAVGGEPPLHRMQRHQRGPAAGKAGIVRRSKSWRLTGDFQGVSIMRLLAHWRSEPGPPLRPPPSIQPPSPVRFGSPSPTISRTALNAIPTAMITAACVRVLYTHDFVVLLRH